MLAAVGEDAGLWPTVVPRAARARRAVGRATSRRGSSRASGWASGGEERTADYLERLERGELEPSRVSRRLLDALGDLLGASAGTLARRRRARRRASGPAAAGGTLFRADERRAASWVADDIEAISRAAMAPAPAPIDELDRLFVGGPDG